MAEPPELYRQQEAYHQDTEQAAPRGWLRGIAYAGLLGAVSFGIGFFARKYYLENEPQLEREKPVERVQIIGCDLETYFSEQQEAAGQREYMKKLQRERFPIFTLPGEYSERANEPERGRTENHKVLIKNRKEGRIEERVTDRAGVIGCTEEDIEVTERLFRGTPKLR